MCKVWGTELEEELVNVAEFCQNYHGVRCISPIDFDHLHTQACPGACFQLSWQLWIESPKTSGLTMLVKIFVIVVAAYISWEIIEHLLLPLIGRIFWKGRRLLTGPEGMIGKNGRVREWRGNSGKVDIQSEIWNAECDVPLEPGDRVVVEEIRGLTLKVSKRNSQT